jgi:serine/threonine-protein kinase
VITRGPGAGDLAPGQWIEGWRVIEKLGAGSFGQVYRVEKEGLFFALKLIVRQAADPAEQSRVEGRTQRELECLLALRHPNISRVWSHGRWPHPTQGQVYLVLDYVDGFNVAQWKERCAPTPHEAVVLFATLARALAYMHKRGVKHRDLKPANIMVSRRDRQPVLVDYGAADRVGSETLTAERLPPGTPRHTSPEALRFEREHRKEPHARYEYQIADEIFAFGVTLYDVLTVARLDSAPQYLPVSSEVLEPQRAHRVNPRVPVALSELVAELLSRDPKQRPVDFEVVYRKLMELAPLQGGEWHGQPIDPPTSPAAASTPASVAAPARERWGDRLRRLGQRVASPWRARRGAWRAAAGAALALVMGLSLVLAGRSAEPERGAAAREAAPPGEVRAEPPAPLGETATWATPWLDDDDALAPLKSQPPVPLAPTKKDRSVKQDTPVKVNAPALCSQKTPPPASQPERLRQWCRCAGFALAFVSACAGTQVRPLQPPPENCPKEALAAMKRLGLEKEDRLGITLDSSRPNEESAAFKSGPIISVVTDPRSPVPVGTLLFGEVWAGPLRSPHTGSDEYPLWVIRYNRLQLPGKEAVPACLATGDVNYLEYQEGSQPGNFVYDNVGMVAYVVDHWI